MSKKHYEAIAAILKKSQSYDKNYYIADEAVFEHGWDCAVDRIASDLADYFANQSERFDRDRFIKACGQD